MVRPSTVKKTRAVPGTMFDRTSHSPGSSFLMSGIPSGQPNCAVLMSRPTVLRSCSPRSSSHSRTGSWPPAVRKNRTERSGSRPLTSSILIVPKMMRIGLWNDCPEIWARCHGTLVSACAQRRHRLRHARVACGDDPFLPHRPSPGTGFAAHDHPVDLSEIEIRKWTEERRPSRRCPATELTKTIRGLGQARGNASMCSWVSRIWRCLDGVVRGTEGRVLVRGSATPHAPLLAHHGQALHRSSRPAPG